MVDAESQQGQLVEGSAHILLVEDEEVVCDAATQMLNSLGYTTSVCRNGREAADLYQSKWQSIDLVILDLVMPIMGGKETFRALKDINPNVIVLLSSGYSLDGDAESIMAEGAQGFIQKPYRRALFSQKISKMLHPEG